MSDPGQVIEIAAPVPHRPRIELAWPDGTPPQPLSGHAVHVWDASLDVDADQQAALARTLTAEELDRACGYRSELLANRFIAGRGPPRVVHTGPASGA